LEESHKNRVYSKKVRPWFRTSSNHIYPLVNVYITMEITVFNG
jgi:hypothetical protein